MDDTVSVEQLLQNAEDLVAHEHYRAAIMEAMTALEERANQVVFESLKTRKGLPTNLVKWLKDKTKYNFDDKLHPIGEFALGKPISKGERLWNDYKKARDLRNKVSHTAQRIDEQEARSVIQTVKEWLYFLEGARDVRASTKAPDATMEFLSLYAMLASRFRFPRGTTPVSIVSAAKNAEKRGQLSPEATRLVADVVASRNRVAHGIPLPPDEISRLTRELKGLMRKLKGIELDGSSVDLPR